MRLADRLVEDNARSHCRIQPLYTIKKRNSNGLRRPSASFVRRAMCFITNNERKGRCQIQIKILMVAMSCRQQNTGYTCTTKSNLLFESIPRQISLYG